jgi:hypothetical protein
MMPVVSALADNRGVCPGLVKIALLAKLMAISADDMTLRSDPMDPGK